jgi:thiamine biosynthesis lipoprotein
MRTLLILTTIGVLASCASSTEPIRGNTYLLGTILNIAIHDDGYGEALIDRAFQRVAEIEAKMSTSTEDYETTELLAVNRAAGDRAVTVSPDTYTVLETALAFSRETGGAFDVSIWPLVDLWGIGTERARVPSETEMLEARALVDYRLVELLPERDVYLPLPGMGVDVGAIAKGYAADESASILREAGVRHALLDFGGNILLIGGKPDGSDWRIGVQRPDAERSAFIGVLTLRDQSVVTSGPYERFFEEEGVRYHHILDASTGYPARSGLEQVTIVTPRSIDADALSTASFVLGLDGARRLIESRPNTEAVFVTDDRLVYRTSGADEFFELTDSDYRLAE